jgi:hypothetical protein
VITDRRVLVSEAESSSQPTGSAISNAFNGILALDFASMFQANDIGFDNQFSKNGYTTAMIPNLSYSIIITLVSGLWYFISNVAIQRMVTVRSNCFVKFLAYGGERVLWISLMLSMIELSLFSTYNILNPIFLTVPRILSLIAALLTFIFLVSFPIFVYKLTNRHYTQLWNPEFYHRYAFFFCEFKLSKKSSKTFMSVIMGRLILFGIIVAAFQNVPFAQTLIVSIMQLLYLFILVKVDPFVSKVMKIMNLVLESALMFVFICYCVLGWDMANPGKMPIGVKNFFADILIWGIVLVVVTAIACMIYMVVMKIWFTIKRCIDGQKITGNEVQQEEEQAIFDSDDQAAVKKEEPKEENFDLEAEFMDGGLGRREN